MSTSAAPKPSVPRVTVISGGFGDITTAVTLKRSGFNLFTVFEQSDGPGGTWWDNRYPGCEVDIPSHAYSFSFMTYDRSGMHAKQPELEGYAKAVVDRSDLLSHFSFATRVTEVRWDDVTETYRVQTTRGESFNFDIEVSCLGLSSVPQYPSWPGLEQFKGPIFHTSRWEPQHDLRDKRVALVGTGSTGVQVGPAIAPIVQQLYVFQREPGWILPKMERQSSPLERSLYRHFPVLQKLRRAKLFLKAERRVRAFDVDNELQQQFREQGLAYIDSAISDPAVRPAVTPNYPWGCKRPVYASTVYEPLNRDNVELVPRPVMSVTEHGIVDEAGVERDVDAIILGTGFWPTRFLSTLEVVGPNRVRLHDVWGDNPQAFLGITLSTFPNFSMCYGPNTNGGWSIIAQQERQAEIAVRAVKRLQRHGGVVDTRAFAMNRYVEWIDGQIASQAGAMEAGCHNYYHSASGRNVTQWPKSHGPYYALTELPPLVGFVHEIQTGANSSRRNESEEIHDSTG